MTLTESRPAAATPVTGGGQLAGLGTMVRFMLRRDRIRIPAWLAALTLLTIPVATTFRDLYPTGAERQLAAETMNSAAGLAMSGPSRYLADYHFGSMLGHQMLGFVVILVAVMSVLMLVRHTRAEEESGRAELVRANVVGRHAPLAAALIVVVATNLALALVLTLGLGGLGIESITWSGSLLYGAAHAAVGIFFAAVAAVTIQITEYPRGASGMAMGALGLAYVLRAAGDVGDSALSWLSPIGWAQRTYVYVDDRWWPLLIAAGLAAVLTVVGFALSLRRDVGAGMRPPRRGRADASQALTRPTGFALRLHRGVLIGFVAALALFGMAYGSIFGDAEEMLAGIDVMEEMLAEIGGASIVEAYASMVMVVLAIIASIYAVMAALRPRGEENAGRAEAVLATGLSRSRWVASHLVIALAGSAGVMLTGGLAMGIAGAGSTGDAAHVPNLAGASLAYVPAIWVTIGVAVALYGWLPRASAVVWLVPAYAFLVGYLGQLLQFPGWMNNISPFGHVPQLPSAEFDAVPLVILTLVAAALIGVGLVGFRRRDLETV